MNFTSENVMHDIEVELAKRSNEEWSNADRVLLKAQLHIASLQRQLDHKDLTDEEIISIYQSLWKFLPSEEPDLAKDIKKFARAILRKAQEK